MGIFRGQCDIVITIIIIVIIIIIIIIIITSSVGTYQAGSPDRRKKTRRDSYSMRHCLGSQCDSYSNITILSYTYQLFLVFSYTYQHYQYSPIHTSISTILIYISVLLVVLVVETLIYNKFSVLLFIALVQCTRLVYQLSQCDYYNMMH